jgi:hypothetical protein
MENLRHTRCALNLETVYPRPFFEVDELKDFHVELKNRAKDI